jgi:hypothetical protein
VDLMSGFGYILGELGVICRKAFIDLGFGLLPGVTIFFLEYSGQGLELAADTSEVVVGKFAPPRFGLAAHLFPFTFQNIFVQRVLLELFVNAVPGRAGARDICLQCGAVHFLSWPSAYR